jgi:histidine phosphotransferase ChpT
MAIEIDLKIAEYMCSRICHDLIGPVGAIANGIEFLGGDGDDMARDALALLEESAGQAARRLEFFRIAFGASVSDAMIPEAKIAELGNAIAPAEKVTAEWRWASGGAGDMPGRTGKLLLNLFLVCLEALPRGGHVTVSTDAAQAQVVAAGPGAVLRDEFVHAFRPDAPVDAVSARGVPAYLATKLAQD